MRHALFFSLLGFALGGLAGLMVVIGFAASTFNFPTVRECKTVGGYGSHEIIICDTQWSDESFSERLSVVFDWRTK